MNTSRPNRYRLPGFIILVVSFTCIIVGNLLFKVGTTQHIVLSVLIVLLSVTAYFVLRSGRK